MRASVLVCATLGCRAGEAPPPVDPAVDPGLTDFHAHAFYAADSDVPALLAAMEEHQVARALLSRPPNPLHAFAGTGSDTADLMAFFAPFAGERLYLYGGQELMPLLHASGRPTAFTMEELYPQGADPAVTQEMLDEMTAIAVDPDPWEAEFRRLATEAADGGRYVGFGEIAPLHLALRPSHPDIRFPADHPWLLWLSDLAAERGMFLDVHMEVTDASLAELDGLLAHNRATPIVWAHAGWSTTGAATPAVLADALAAHPNLYLSLKLREPESEAYAAVHPLDADGTIKPEWRALLEAWPDRILAASDMKYWEDDAPIRDVFAERIGDQVGLLDQLDAETRAALRSGSAAALIGR